MTDKALAKPGWLLVLAVVWLLAGNAAAAQFSAQMVVQDGEKLALGKIFVQDGKMRQEFNDEEGQAITIVRPDLKKVWVILPREHGYMELPLKTKLPGQFIQIPPDALTKRLVGKETVNGYEAEKYEVRKAIGRDCTVLGICLGAQMIAATCGKRVFAHEKEMGWRTICGCSPAWQKIFPKSFEVFHWHKETFDLPEGAQLLVNGDVITNQAFLIRRALGIQFHPEVTEPVIAKWSEDLPKTDRLKVLEETGRRIEGNRQLACAITEAFCTNWHKEIAGDLV